MTQMTQMTQMIQKTPGSNNPDEKRAGVSYTQNERELIDEAYDRLSQLEEDLTLFGASDNHPIDGGNAFSRPWQGQAAFMRYGMLPT